MAQQISANDLAESVMAFNTNYSDSGLFGVYAVAKVRFSINRVAHL
jgi:processing peptidase subunit beta